MNGNQGLYAPIPSNTFTNGISIFIIFQKNNTINTLENIISRCTNNIASPIDIYNNSRCIGDNINYTILTSPLNIQTATGYNLLYISVNKNG